MRTPHPASPLVAAALLLFGGCNQEAPKLHREKPAPQAPIPPPPSTPVAPVAKEAAASAVREKLGAGQCRTCHRLQYDSWVKSGHARKALDCEGCHGNGSDYAKAEVMKDLARSTAAGLIFQTADFCAKCHPTADASYLPKAHAHQRKHLAKPVAAP
jgi:hypothetical protein